MDEVFSEAPDYEPLSQEEATLGGQPGLVQVFNTSDPEIALRNVRGKMYIAVGPDVVLVFVFMADLSDYAAFVDQVDAIVDSLEFLN
jgi:hypothetical protein